MQANNGKLVLWKLYLHRYLRLTPLYAFTVLFIAYVLPHMSQGPYWIPNSSGMSQSWCVTYFPS